MAADLQAAVKARNPEVKAMREGWISFGSIKLAMPTHDGLLGLADHRRVASALCMVKAHAKPAHKQALCLDPQFHFAGRGGTQYHER